MQFPSRKPAHLVEIVSGFEREQELPQLIRHRGLYPFGIVIRMEQTESFMAKAGKLHRIRS